MVNGLANPANFFVPPAPQTISIIARLEYLILNHLFRVIALSNILEKELKTK
jgi:hypothetical protein